MARQFLRAYTLQIGEADPLGLGTGGFSISSSSDRSLDLAFQIDRDERPWPNKAEIQIWNLNADHRQYLAKERGLPCRLEAGYRGSTGVIFDGFLRTGNSVKNGADWITTVSAGDGEVNKSGEPLASSFIRKSWPRGTPLIQIITDFADVLDVDFGNTRLVGAAAATRLGPALIHGLAVDGPVVDEWIYFTRSAGLKWSIQDGAIQLRAGGIPAGVVPLISADNGLIGRVATSTKIVRREDLIEKKIVVTETAVVQCEALLHPPLKPGYQFVLKSAEAVGTYLCTAVSHVGDTSGLSWYTRFEGQGAS